MAWNINFDGKTKLKDWWGVVRDNFLYLKEFITEVNNSIGARIAEARGINPTKHIVESADDMSGWLITDHYLVPVPTTDDKVVYSEYAYVDDSWQVVGSTQEADLTEVKTQLAECATIEMVERSNVCRELDEVCSVTIGADSETTYKNTQAADFNEVIYDGTVTVEGIGGYPRSITISTPMYLDKDASNYYSTSDYPDATSLKIAVSCLGKTKEYIPKMDSYPYDFKDTVISLSPTEEAEMVKGRLEIGIKCTLCIKTVISGNDIINRWAVKNGAWSISVPKTTYLVSAE